jgi:protocatechuate 3,4-dioxygenase beta subunit
MLWEIATEPWMARMVRPGARGTRIQLYGKVTDLRGDPIEGVCIEIRQQNPAPSRRFSGWGRATTDGRGVFRFWTLQPESGKRGNGAAGACAETIPSGSAEPIEMVVLARGLDEPLFACAYFDDGLGVDVDLHPGTLSVRQAPAALVARAEGENGWRVDITLPVDGENPAHGGGRLGPPARRGGGPLERFA